MSQSLTGSDRVGSYKSVPVNHLTSLAASKAMNGLSEIKVSALVLCLTPDISKSL
jgi:hypothetical protein